MATDLQLLAAAIRDIPDFPKPGIVFKDITPILSDGTLFHRSVGELLKLPFYNEPIDKVVGIDARGFIFGAALADRIGAGFIPMRKKGKLPWTTREQSYALEYGEATLEVHADAINPGERILLIDDLLATGGTAAAAMTLIEQMGGSLIGMGFVVELSFLNGREKLGTHPVESLLIY